MLAVEDDLVQARPGVGVARAALKEVRLLEATVELGDVAVGLRELWWCSGDGRQSWSGPGAQRHSRGSLEKKTIAVELERRGGGPNLILRGWEAKGDLN